MLIKNDPSYNEAWPRAVVPYRAVHGVDEPAQLPWLPNDGTLHAALPAGTPYGLVGTSSVYKRESFPGFVPSWSDTFDGLDAFNTGENGQSSNWGAQGADAGKYSNSDIWAIRIARRWSRTRTAATARTAARAAASSSTATPMERLRILGEIPAAQTRWRGAAARSRIRFFYPDQQLLYTGYQFTPSLLWVQNQMRDIRIAGRNLQPRLRIIRPV